MEEACFTRAVIKGIKVHTFHLKKVGNGFLFGIAAGVAPYLRRDTLFNGFSNALQAIILLRVTPAANRNSITFQRRTVPRR